MASILKNILLKAKKWMLFIYLLLVVEYILYAIMPWMLGKSIDSLLVGEIVYFMLYAILSVSGLLIGFIRRRLDTRIFSRILLRETLAFFNSMIGRIDASKMLTRLDKIRLFTDFTENFLPGLFKAIFYIVVSSIFLFYAMGIWTCLILALMIASTISSFYLTKKIEAKIELAQEQEEAKNHSMVLGNVRSVKRSMFKLQRIGVAYSDLQALNWGIVDMCCIGCQLIAIMVLVSLKLTIGDITASLAYVGSLCMHFQVFPQSLEMVRHLNVASMFLKRKD